MFVFVDCFIILCVTFIDVVEMLQLLLYEVWEFELVCEVVFCLEVYRAVM